MTGSTAPTINDAMIERAQKAARSLTVLHDGEHKYIGVPSGAECVIEIDDEEGSTYPIVLVRPRRYGRAAADLMEAAYEGSALTWIVANKGDMCLLRSWRVNAETAGLVDAEGELTALGLRLRAAVNASLSADVREVLLRLIHEEVEWARIVNRA